MRLWPPEGTTALLIDVSSEGGAVNVYETPRDKFVEGVGQKESENLVLISWQANWFYYSIGSVRVAYLSSANPSTVTHS